jgi:hypothetical protein
MTTRKSRPFIVVIRDAESAQVIGEADFDSLWLASMIASFRSLAPDRIAQVWFQAGSGQRILLASAAKD